MPTYNQVLRAHRDKIARITDQQAIRRLRKVYNATIHDIERRLARLPGARRDSFTAHQYRAFLGQLREGMILTTRRLSDTMAVISLRTQMQALNDLIRDIKILESQFTGASVVLPVQEAARFQGVITGVRDSFLRANRTSMARYGARLIGKMENQLSSALLVGDDVGGAISRVVDTADIEWWQAERIVRTENMWAYNATQHQAVKESADVVPDMMMRWTEHISDVTGRALDSRVDGGRIEDSHAMHGQVAPPGGVFRFPNTMPDGSPIPPELSRFAGKTWANPPNRPNDRASLAPWRPHWGIPAWQCVGGVRVPL